jgi:hypothetical protein
MDRINDDGVTGHSEVIVRTPDADLLGGILRMGIREFSGQLLPSKLKQQKVAFEGLRKYAVDVVEVAVGFILVLFIEFVCVKSFVAELFRFFKDKAVGLPRCFGMWTRT